MIIRNARETDFVECVSIAHRAWPEFNEREAIYHILCRHFPDTCFMSEEGGKIQGFLLGFISQADTREAYIHLICVEPSAQRQGVAGRLPTVTNRYRDAAMSEFIPNDPGLNNSDRDGELSPSYPRNPRKKFIPCAPGWKNIIHSRQGL